MEEKLIVVLFTAIAGGLFGAGGLLGFYLSRVKWKTETEQAIYRAFFDEGIKFLDELSELVGRRYSLLESLVSALEDNLVRQNNASKGALEKAKKEREAKHR
jgi:hypothetical protein